MGNKHIVGRTVSVSVPAHRLSITSLRIGIDTNILVVGLSKVSHAPNVLRRCTHQSNIRGFILRYQTGVCY